MPSPEKLRRAHLIEKDERPDHLPLAVRRGAVHLEAADVAGARHDDELEGVTDALSPGPDRLREASSWGASVGRVSAMRPEYWDAPPRIHLPSNGHRPGASPRFRDTLEYRILTPSLASRESPSPWLIAPRHCHARARLRIPRSAAPRLRRESGAPLRSRKMPYMPVTIGEAPAIGVDGHAAARRDGAVRDEAAALAFWAKAEILEKQDRVDGEGVIELGDVDVGG